MLTKFDGTPVLPGELKAMLKSLESTLKALEVEFDREESLDMSGDCSLQIYRAHQRAKTIAAAKWCTRNEFEPEMTREIVDFITPWLEKYQRAFPMGSTWLQEAPYYEAWVCLDQYSLDWEFADAPPF